MFTVLDVILVLDGYMMFLFALLYSWAVDVLVLSVGIRNLLIVLSLLWRLLVVNWCGV